MDWCTAMGRKPRVCVPVHKTHNRTGDWCGPPESQTKWVFSNGVKNKFRAEADHGNSTRRQEVNVSYHGNRDALQLTVTMFV